MKTEKRTGDSRKFEKTKVHEVIATSFADPADIAAFRRAKARGLSDLQAFRFGDNGMGRWGDDTTEPRPMCALPPEDWKPKEPHARGALVSIEHKGFVIRAELRDTMPRRANIKNGAGIDLNPAACAELGLRPPIRVPVRWWWHEEQPQFMSASRSEERAEADRKTMKYVLDRMVAWFKAKLKVTTRAKKQ